MTMPIALAPNSVGRASGSERWTQGHVGHEMFLGRVDLNGIAMPFARNAEVYGEGEAAEYVYKVLSGAVRTYKVLSDGRRQIVGFYLPGDVLGFDPGEEHSCSAEAIANCQILLVRRAKLFKVAERDADISRCLWALTATELRRSQQHALLLIKSAQERLATFLLDMAERLSAKSEFDLPMPRQDIADYLGLTIETVSRTLTQLADSAIIQFLTSRRIVLRNRAILSEMNA